jgi:hypothetical protein
MAKNEMFYVDRHTDPANPELIKADDHQLMRVYENKDDLETDISNIEDNEVVATQDNDYEGIEIADEVVEGNQNPATSNAVYNSIQTAKIDIYKPNVEERTGRIWVDGKPIYRRYFDVTVPWTQTSNVWYGALEDTSVSYGTLIHYEGTWGYNWTGIGYQPYCFGSVIPTPNTYGSAGEILASCVRLTDHTLQVYCYIGDGRHSALSSDCVIKLVVYYTKSTDSAIDPLPASGGGISTTSSNLIGLIGKDGISYSQTETLTGSTWIDGKPIYRKTFKGIAPLTVQGAAGHRTTYTLVLDETTLYSEIITAQGWVDWIRFYGTANSDTLRMNINFTNVSGNLEAQSGCALCVVQHTSPVSISPVEGALYVGYNVIAETQNAPTMPYCFTIEYTKR